MFPNRGKKERKHFDKQSRSGVQKNLKKSQDMRKICAYASWIESINHLDDTIHKMLCIAAPPWLIYCMYIRDKYFRV